MTAMDSVPEREFLGIYDRLHFPTEGIGSPREFNERMTSEIKRCIREKNETKSEGRRKYLQRCITRLRNLRSSEFAIRVFEEIYSDPNGYIALSVKYGKPEAKRILLHRFRKKRNRYRIT